jgi:hypothetical protein
VSAWGSRPHVARAALTTQQWVESVDFRRRTRLQTGRKRDGRRSRPPTRRIETILQAQRTFSATSELHRHDTINHQTIRPSPKLAGRGMVCEFPACGGSGTLPTLLSPRVSTRLFRSRETGSWILRSSVGRTSQQEGDGRRSFCFWPKIRSTRCGLAVRLCEDSEGRRP